MRKYLVRVAEYCFPRWVWKRRLASKPVTGEAELVLIPALSKRNKVAIDVGAAQGSYVQQLLFYSSKVIGFEPRSDAAELLIDRYKYTRIVNVFNLALSDTSAVMNMRIPLKRKMLSTLESDNLLEDIECKVVAVNTCTLDSRDIKNVGFIKIDVEGHEQSVLEGGRETIIRERPVLLIEAEERHKPGTIDWLMIFFNQLHYDAYFFDEGKVRSIKEFDTKLDQNPDNLVDNHRRIGRYINNFIFIPQESQVPQTFTLLGF